MGHRFYASVLAGVAVGSCSDPTELLGSTESTSKRCTEPVVCPAAISDMKPKISCLDPSEVNVGAETTLHIYGAFLEDSRGTNTKVRFDDREAEGIPTSTCHLTVAIPRNYFSRAGNVDVVVTTDRSSAPAKLPIR